MSSILNTARTLYAENEAATMRQAISQATRAHFSAAVHPTNIIGKVAGFGSFAHTLARRTIGEPTYEPGGIKNFYKSDLKEKKGKKGRSPRENKRAAIVSNEIENRQATDATRTEKVMLNKLSKVDVNTSQTASYLEKLLDVQSDQYEMQKNAAAFKEENLTEAERSARAMTGISGADLAKASNPLTSPTGGLLGALGFGGMGGMTSAAGGAALGATLGPMLIRALPYVAIAALIGKGVWDGLNKWQETGDFSDAVYAAIDGATLGIVSALTNLFAAASAKFWKNNKEDILDTLNIAGGNYGPALKKAKEAEAKAKAAAANSPAPSVPAASTTPVAPYKGGFLGALSFGAGLKHTNMPPAASKPKAVPAAKKGGESAKPSATPAFTAGGRAVTGGMTGEILNLINSAESRKNGYDSVFGNVPYLHLTGGRPLSDLTIDEVQQLQKTLVNLNGRGEGGAMGRYQIVTKTFRSLKNQMGLKGNETFSPELQDQMAIHLMKGRGLDSFLTGKMSANDFQNALAQEWAGIPMTNGLSAHHGKGSNKATVSVAQVQSVLGGGKAPTGGGGAVAMAPTDSYSEVSKSQAVASQSMDVPGFTKAARDMAWQAAAAATDTQMALSAPEAPSASAITGGGAFLPTSGSKESSAAPGIQSATEGVDDIIAKILVAMGAVSQT